MEDPKETTEEIRPLDEAPAKKKWLVPVVLIVLLLGAGGYIAYGKLTLRKEKKKYFNLGPNMVRSLYIRKCLISPPHALRSL